MAVEVRRVAPDWEHPKREDGSYRPMHQWTRQQIDEANREYEAEGTPPLTRDDVMPFWSPEEATAYQLYEDTSEGTPLGPVFEERTDFVNWLRTLTGLSEAAADKFVAVGRVASAATVRGELFVGLQIAEARWGVLEKAPSVLDIGDKEGFETARSMLEPDYERGDDALVLHPGFRKRWAFVCVCIGCSSGYCTALPTQPCARAQSYAPADQSGGVTVNEAVALGWMKTDRGWICPFCSGDDQGLRRVFRKSAR